MTPSLRSDRPLYADSGLTRLVAADEADVVIANAAGKVIHPTIVQQMNLVADAAGRVHQRGKDAEPAEPVKEQKPKPVRSAPPAEKDATRRKTAKRKKV